MIKNTVKDIRDEFAQLYSADEFVIDKTGVEVVEIIGAQFIVNEDAIFGTPNDDWHGRELQWYKSQSLNVFDIPPPVPSIWIKVADSDGRINSNYGHMIWSKENGNQYDNVLSELKSNSFSRRAQMIYTRPSMHSDYNRGGMSDFCCTSAVQYFIRNNKLISYVSMRSNDAVHGFKGDSYFQKYVQSTLANELGIEVGDLIWNVGSLHIYSRHFSMIEEYIKSNE